MPFMGYGQGAVIIAHLQTITSHISLHTAFDPNGGFEVSGGAYERQPITLALNVTAASIGVAPSAEVQFALPANQSVGFFGLWDLAFSQTAFIGMFPRFASPMFPVTCDAFGVFTLPFQTIGPSIGTFPPGDGQLTFTNLLHNASVLLWSVGDNLVLNGFVGGQTYYVVNDDPATFTFQLSVSPPIGTPSIPGLPVLPLAPFGCLLQIYVPLAPRIVDTVFLLEPSDGQFELFPTAGG
jgi:hypothetical protein